MPEYQAEVPVIGVCFVTVEADSPEAALDAAVDEAYEQLDRSGIQALETYEAVKRVSAGNLWLVDAPEAATVTDEDGESTQAEYESRW